MASPSRNSVALRELLRPQMNQREFADHIGVSPQSVSAWCSGDAQPSVENMQEIQKVFPHLTIPLWLEPAAE